VKYLSSWSVQSIKSCGVVTSIKVRDIDLGAFQILSVGIWWVIDIVTWLFFSGV